MIHQLIFENNMQYDVLYNKPVSISVCLKCNILVGIFICALTRVENTFLVKLISNY